MSVACLQRPKMGSSQPPDGNLPFGYNLSDHDLPFLTPPAPPPGDPLLSNDESRRLNDFFEVMTSNQYATSSYGEGLNFSDQWISQLPPNFLGHTTSFGQQPPQSSVSSIHGMPAASFQDGFTFSQNMMTPPQPQLPLQPRFAQHVQHHQQQQQHQHHHHHPPPIHTPLEHNDDADVAAALTSLHDGHQNGNPSRANSLIRGAIIPPQHAGTPVDQARPLPRNRISTEQSSPTRSSGPNEAYVLFNSMFRDHQRPSHQGQIEAPGLQWGSDSSFARAQGYIPPEHESNEVLELKRLDMLKVFSIDSSAAPTRSTSPLGNGEGSSSGLRNSNLNEHAREEDSSEVPPRKRRKSKAKEETEEEINDLSSIPPKAAARKRKSKADLNGTPEASLVTQDTPGKRRKSAPNGMKPPRENLTDAQKRENHIKSEQRRRGAIKEGFDGLYEIVPSLKGGGYSKATTLAMAGEWLEILLKDNDELARR
ncbi:hypothetical protein F4779DRAFT_617720 [Xylariaceae sp. FL0662B]|nr:hypothetical protein F4779DRAFT_617720 [Xylariaceae sp. FL0662B]